MLYFDNAPVHNAEGVQESLAFFGFRRMEQPPYGLDLALSDFFSQCNETGLSRASF
jgi:hypothetical protein